MYSSLAFLTLLAAAPPRVAAVPSYAPAARQAAADSVVAGRVTDASTGAPLASVIVALGGTSIGALTGDDGRWSLVLPTGHRGGGVRLVFARAGYATLERTARESETLDVALVPSARALETVTVTALRGDADAPIARSVVGEEEIARRYSGQDVSFLLQAVPGVTAYSDAGAYGNYSYLRLRGIDQTRINVTLDGVPLSEPEDQGLYFSNYPDFGSSIASVQVQRGVGTSQYGTASFAGAINFESVSLADAPRGGQLQLGGGSFGSWRASGEWASGLLDNGAAVYARLSSIGSDGYRRNSGSRGDAGWLSAGWFGDRDLVKLTAFTGRTRNEMAYYASSVEDIRRDPRDNPLAEDDDYRTSLVSLAWARALGTDASLQTTAYHVDFGGAYDVAWEGDLYSYGLASRLTGAFATWSARLGAVALDVGAHGNTYRRDHDAAMYPDVDAKFYENQGRKNEGSVFAKANVELGRVTLYGDVQARRAAFRYLPSENAGIDPLSVAWSFVNPKAGLRVQLTRALSGWASYGATGREPTRTDMFAGLDDVDASSVDEVGPLTRVRPEKLRDLEAGLEWRAPRLSAGVTAYAMEFRDEIAPIGQLTALGMPLRKNVPESYRRGVDVDLAWRPSERLTASGNLNVSRNRIALYEDEASGATYRNVEPLLTPSVVANASLVYRPLRALELSLDGRHLGRSQLDNSGNADFVVPPSTVADVGARWTTGRVGMLAQLRNVADRRAYLSGYTDGVTSYYYLQAPRNFLVTMTLGF
jgi:iron complex outermembrane receptor protein